MINDEIMKKIGNLFELIKGLYEETGRLYGYCQAENDNEKQQVYKISSDKVKGNFSIKVNMSNVNKELLKHKKELGIHETTRTNRK